MTQKQYAILTLQAPMMSFGVTAVDERRPTGIFPGRSMLTGLIANALGWRRQDYQKLQELQERIRYAVRVEHDNGDEDGVTIIHDLQTVELHKNDKAWTTSGKPEGRDGTKKTYNSPELRTLEYVANSRAVVALRLESPEEHPTLEEVGHALQWPARPLHIGRKCCIPETMIFTGFRETETATGALTQEPCLWTASAIQWDPEEGDESVRQDRESWTSDLKDWGNKIHVGRRRINEGTQINPVEEE